MSAEAGLLLRLATAPPAEACSLLAALPVPGLRSLCSLCAIPVPRSAARATCVRRLLDRHACFDRYRRLLATHGALCEREFGRLCAPLLPYFGAMGHIVQEEAGSAVRVSETHVLTCAHCISEDPEPALGQTRVLLFASGVWAVGRCVAFDQTKDLALLALLCASESSTPAPRFPVAAASRVKYPVRVACVGNPSEFDLESDEKDATTEFTPPVFHTSLGRISGSTRSDRLGLGLGSMQHSAWTYWGHSGAPLLGQEGQLLGLHNSWDEERGTRHCVSAREIAEFLAEHT